MTLFKAFPGGPHGVAAGNFTRYKIGGQVPSRENIELMRLAERKPKRFNPMQLLDHTEPRMSVDSILDGLGMDPAQRNDWKSYLQKALQADNELLMRRDLMSKMQGDRMNPELRRALFQRSLVYYKGRVQKSMVEVVTIDELHKAMFTKEEIKERFMASEFKREPEGMKKTQMDSKIENLCARKAMSRKEFDEKYGLSKATPLGGKTKRGYTVKMVNGKKTYVKDKPKKGRTIAAHPTAGNPGPGTAVNIVGEQNAMTTNALKLLAGNTGTTQDDLHYRAFLRGFIQGPPGEKFSAVTHLLGYPGAKRAMNDLAEAEFDKSLEKAEPKGGKYHKRVTNKDGKHRYYYNPDDYKKSKDAHVDGSEAGDNYLNNSLKTHVEKAGDQGCDVQTFKSLVKKYGSKKVGDALKRACTEGGMTYKDKKLYLKKQLKKSERFTMKGDQ